MKKLYLIMMFMALNSVLYAKEYSDVNTRIASLEKKINAMIKEEKKRNEKLNELADKLAHCQEMSGMTKEQTPASKKRKRIIEEAEEEE